MLQIKSFSHCNSLCLLGVEPRQFPTMLCIAFEPRGLSSCASIVTLPSIPCSSDEVKGLFRTESRVYSIVLNFSFYHDSAASGPDVPPSLPSPPPPLSHFSLALACLLHSTNNVRITSLNSCHLSWLNNSNRHWKTSCVPDAKMLDTNIDKSNNIFTELLNVPMPNGLRHHPCSFLIDR